MIVQIKSNLYRNKRYLNMIRMLFINEEKVHYNLYLQHYFTFEYAVFFASIKKRRLNLSYYFLNYGKT